MGALRHTTSKRSISDRISHLVGLMPAIRRTKFPYCVPEPVIASSFMLSQVNPKRLVLVDGVWCKSAISARVPLRGPAGLPFSLRHHGGDALLPGTDPSQLFLWFVSQPRSGSRMINLCLIIDQQGRLRR